MRNEMGTLFASAVLAVAGVVTVQAADIASLTGHMTKLDGNSSA